jgi:hypothetical protein
MCSVAKRLFSGPSTPAKMIGLPSRVTDDLPVGIGDQEISFHFVRTVLQTKYRNPFHGTPPHRKTGSRKLLALHCGEALS